jgi:DNA adenine methylase
VKNKVQPPIRYPGSKFRAYKYIEPFIDKIDHNYYLEPFCGSAAVFFQKDLSKANWLNDLDEELINFFRIIKNKANRKILISKIKDFSPSKKEFENLKISKPKSKIERAIRYFLINRTAYSGIMNLPNWGYHQTKSVPPSKWPNRIELAGEKLKDVKLSSLDFEKVINKSFKIDKVLLFIDPPYFKADQKRAYIKSFNLDDHLRLSRILKKSNVPFVLTYDDCIEIRELYSWASIKSSEWMYHTANSLKTTRKIGKELIITNFNI